MQQKISDAMQFIEQLQKKMQKNKQINRKNSFASATTFFKMKP